MADVDAAAGGRDPLDSVDRALAVAAVFENDDEDLVAGLDDVFLFHVGDEAFELEDLGDVFFQVGRRHQGLFVARGRRVTNTRQHVGNRVGHHGITSWTS